MSNKKEITLRTLETAGHVGIDILPDLLVNKNVEKGFVFNVMCIGETGCGKSTLMDTLFNTSFESKVCSHTLNQVKLRAHTYELQESNVQLKLTICDTVGYGDQINKNDSYKVIVDYVNVQFEKYLEEELKIKRSLDDYHDSRIHVCLYFICPTGHGLKSLDLMCMKQLESKVNILPIIAKADTISKTELKSFKEKIMEELKRNQVRIYQFPTNDEMVADSNAAMNEQIPFAVVGSTDFVRMGNTEMRARQYPWGMVDVENELHCDIAKLRDALICTNMEDLRESTHNKHYQLYREKRLQEMGFCDIDSENKPVSFQKIFEFKHRNHASELLAKKEAIRQCFVERVRGKQFEMMEDERTLHSRFEGWRRYYAEEKRRLDETNKKLTDEYREFTAYKNSYLASHKIMTLGKSRKKL